MTSLEWDRFSSWIYGVVTVTFDIELGQVIESVYPDHIDISEADRTNICYLSFPDSNCSNIGDSQFHFRFRMAENRSSMAAVVAAEYNDRTSSSINCDPGVIFGFVYFRQTKNSLFRRGYYQKSVVLLSHLPLISLFNRVTLILARKFFEEGRTALEMGCSDINSWPTPCPASAPLDLPLLGTLFNIILPSKSSRFVECGTEVVAISPLHDGELLPYMPDINLFICIFPILESIQNLWELILTAEPLIVMAATPSVSSSAVQHYTKIIHPLSYAADYRPFFTIHDSDFKEISNCNQSVLPNIMLGVTNPFFMKALHHWPNVIRLGDPVGRRDFQVFSKKNAKFLADLSHPGLYSSKKTFLSKDKCIIKRILKGVELKRPLEVQSALLRRYFLELTQSFMIPLERYLTSLMPLAKNIAPFRNTTPKVGEFNIEQFLASLSSGGPDLTSNIRGDWHGLYRRFIKSPNFALWHSNRHREAVRKLQLLHLEALASTKVEFWIRNKQEIQLVDMVLLIRDKLLEAVRDGISLPDCVRDQLKEHERTIIRKLPTDLRSMLDKEQMQFSSYA